MITQELAIPFSLNVTTITATVVLSVIGLGYLLFGWVRKHSWRTLVRGAGFVLLPVGLLLSGVMGQFYHGINALLAWAEVTPQTLWVTIGLSVAGAGLLLYLVGSFIPPVIGEVAKARRAAIAEKKAVAKGAPALASQGGTVPAGFAGASGSASGSRTPAPSSADAAVDNDDEIDAILRKHGIS